MEKKTKATFSMRDFTIRDVEPCVRIIAQTLGKEREERARKDLLEGLEPKTHEYVFLKMKVAVSGGEIAGIGGVYRLDTHPDKIVGIDWFAIKKKYQGKGLGTKFVNWSIRVAKQHKNRLLFVWAVKSAEPFYKRFGFKKSNMKIMPVESKILLVKLL